MPISDDEELLDDRDVHDNKAVEDTGTAVVANSLLLWQQCLRPPCNAIDTAVERDRDDSRLRYGYDDGDEDGDEGGGNAYMAVGPWPRRRHRGLCVTVVDEDEEDDHGPSPVTSTTVVWPPAVRHCLPNGKGYDATQRQHRRQRDGVCGRLRVILDTARLRRGTRVSAVCHSLRRLLAWNWVRDKDSVTAAGRNEAENRVYVMCELDADQRDDADDRVGRRRRRRRRVAIQVSVVRIAHTHVYSFHHFTFTLHYLQNYF